jgi:UDP-N-acetylmuramoyl-tripeptide--D-alanyl-D-alanine ligase
MISNWLSRYKPSYVRSLVYMLQASEYNVADYLDWYYRTSNFSTVEKRKSLKKTPKAIVLLLIGWLIVLLLYLAAFANLIPHPHAFGIVAAIVIVLATPFVLPYIMIVPVVTIRIVQRVAERRIMARAHEKLGKHAAYKIAIAGSFGKTTMREILKTVLAEGKRVAAPPQSNNTPLSISKFIDRLKGDEEVLIFEFGEYYPGDILELCQMVRPDLGIITGVNEAHLKKFKTLGQTTKTIFELADWLKERPLYVNADSKLAKDAAPSQAILYSREGVGEMKVRSGETSLDGTKFELSTNGKTFQLQSGLLGLHQIGPLAAAAHIALRLGLTEEQIKKGMAKTKPFEHRLQSKIDPSGVITLDDSYNGNPSGVEAIIEFLSHLQGHRRIFVTPGLVEMGAHSETVHRQIGEKLAQAGIEKIVLIKNSVTPFIEAGLRRANYAGQVTWFDDALAAYAALPTMTAAGDVVVLQNDWPDQYS